MIADYRLMRDYLAVNYVVFGRVHRQELRELPVRLDVGGLADDGLAADGARVVCARPLEQAGLVEHVRLVALERDYCLVEGKLIQTHGTRSQRYLLILRHLYVETLLQPDDARTHRLGTNLKPVEVVA